MILDINESVDDYYDIKPGQIIKIPNDYASKMIMFVDKEFILPLVMEVYDEKGVFERYEYKKLQLNPVIPDEEFTQEYKDYDF